MPYFDIPMGSKAIHEPTRNDISCPFHVISWIVLAPEVTTRNQFRALPSVAASIGEERDNFVEVTSFLEAFVSWAGAQADIEAVALVGSYARDSATEESDVDLMILTTAVGSYFENRSWMSRFGDVGECKVENWGRVKSLRAFYKDGTEVEYNFSTPDWADVPAEEGTHHVVANGMKIIYDPQCVLKALQESVSSGTRPSGRHQGEVTLVPAPSNNRD